jgi:hypothetical protein
VFERDVVIGIVGAKKDLEDRRAIPTHEGEKWATENGYSFAECSSLSGEGVDEAFDILIRRAANKFGSLYVQ